MAQLAKRRGTIGSIFLTGLVEKKIKRAMGLEALHQ
jgi:hypothetical protein